MNHALYDYFRQNLNQFDVDVLKQRALQSGYDQSDIEEVIGSLHAADESIRFGFQVNSRNLSCAMFFTQSRIIITGFKSSFGLCFFFGYFGELVSHFLNKGKFKKLMKLPPEKLILSSKHKAQIPFSSIDSIALIKPKPFTPGSIIIKSTNDYEFSFAHNSLYFSVEELLKKHHPEFIMK